MLSLNEGMPLWHEPEIPQKTFKAETVYNYTGKFKKTIQHKESPFNLSYSGKDIDTNKKWYLGYKFLDIYWEMDKTIVSLTIKKFGTYQK